MRSGLIRMNREKHYWAVRKQQKARINRKNMNYLGVLRKPRWRQILKAEGLKDNPFSNYYYGIAMRAGILRTARAFKKIGLKGNEMKVFGKKYKTGD